MSDLAPSNRLELPALLVEPGPLAVERRLLADLDQLLPASLAELAARRAPILVIVPSRGLRRHLLAAVARRRDAALGLEIMTLRRAAERVLAVAGERPPAGELLWEVFARRAAAAERALSSALGELVEGYAAATLSLRDLFDAGFDPALADGLDEALAVPASHPGAHGRARALVRAAGTTARRLAAVHCGQASDLLRRAAELVATRGAEALPTHALLVHGFADATGVGTDFLVALLRHGPARVYLDRPPSVGELAGAADAEPAFGRRFRERLSGVVMARQAARPSVAGAIESFAAAGPTAEVREVGGRVRDLLARGVTPEAIGVVARDLTPYDVALRTEWTELGLPFSGDGPCRLTSPAAHRHAALLELLAQPDRLSLDRWLLLRSARRAGASAFELRLALHGLGVSALRGAAELDPETALPAEGGDVVLPVRHGFVGPEEGAEAGAYVARAPRRRVRRAAIERALAEARALTRRLAKWPQRAPVVRHLALIARLRGDLRPDRDAPGEEEIGDALGRLREELPGEVELDRHEVVLLLRRALEDSASEPLGGRGGGVQVLSVTEARGRTFEHLFVLGLHHGSFPRSIGRDPLLPDDLRARLAVVLPDLPRKSEGQDEEVFLFEQLLAAAPHVTLSRQHQDEDGRPLAPSPLLERLRWAGQLPAAEEGTTVEAAPTRDDLARPGPRDLPPAAAAIAAALHLPRRQLLPWLTAALADCAVTAEPAALAAAHLAVLAEHDPDLDDPDGRRLRDRLGPYFGFLGPLRRAKDPRRGDLYVTRLEQLATCPWQVVLQRLLKLEPPPDPGAAVPELGPLVIGSLVHRVLEAIGRAALARAEAERGGDLAAALARTPVPIEWPDDAGLAELARETAAELLREDGLGAWRLDRTLAAMALPSLREARALDLEIPAEVLGVELEGALALAASTGDRRLLFRADRLERIAGQAVLSDFKTGSCFASGRTETRRRHLLREIAGGTRLQAAAYAAALAEVAGLGRYVFVAPDIAETDRRLECTSQDAEAATAFASAVDVALAAWEAGAFFPRLLDAKLEKTNRTCTYCEVAEACLQHDSGARGRLAAWVAARRAGEAATGPAEAAWAALHDVGRSVDDAAATNPPPPEEAP